MYGSTTPTLIGAPWAWLLSTHGPTATPAVTAEAPARNVRRVSAGIGHPPQSLVNRSSGAPRLPDFETVRFPVEALPERVDAVDDPVELVAAVGVGGPEVIERTELGGVAERVLGRLGHRHLPSEKAPVALAGEDPEPLGRLLGEEPGLLVGGRPAEEEARGEADRARARGDEVREVAEPAQVAPPALARDQRAERRRPGHERLATALDSRGDGRLHRVERAARGVAREEDAALLEQLADRGHPEGERRGALVLGIHLAAGEGVVAAEELHAALAADHPDLDRLRRAGGGRPHQDDRRRRLRLDRGSPGQFGTHVRRWGDRRAGSRRGMGVARARVPMPCQRLMSCATRSRWYVASPKVNSDDLARL